MSGDFTPEQKRYLEGFTSGLRAAGGGRHDRAAGKVEPVGPDSAHLKAQDRVTAAGGRLADQEKFKREEHPFDSYSRLVRQAAANEAPKPADNFRWRYHGLFYVAPAQTSYMCRLRIANGVLTHWQFAAVASIAANYAGDYAHVTTRANLQIREIEPKNAVHVVETLIDVGLGSRGSGADNIRNVTGTATAGIDPQELLDTRPYAKAWHHHILNDRSLYGLPRKFNVAFDGAGRIAVLEDTNDIAFQAVDVKGGHGVDAGIHFRLGLGGITGHRDFARDTGVIVRPGDAVAVADAIVRVFIDHGNRTDRNKARLKYLLDLWGFEKFLAAVEEKLGWPLPRVEAEAVAPRPGFDRLAHIGVHSQKQRGLNWIGVALKLGRLSAEQIRGIATLAHRYGDGDIRLTVWQNVLISGVANDNVAAVCEAIEALGLSTEASAIRAGLVACTGNRGCKFAAADTKGHAEAIADWCEQRVQLSVPINIHLTGCHHSCAQHFIGDIGLIGARVAVNEEGDTVEGYHLHIGGGYGPDAMIAREIYRNVRADDVPQVVERVIRAFVNNRARDDESFVSFARRHDTDTLKSLVGAEAVA